MSSEVSGGLATFLLWCAAGNTEVGENIDTWIPSQIPFSLNISVALKNAAGKRGGHVSLRHLTLGCLDPGGPV